MMKKILIIDRDSTTLNDISRLTTALNYEPVVSYNMTDINNLLRDEIAAAFVDIETKIVKIDEIIQFINGPKKIENSSIIPVFFMYTNVHAHNLDYTRQFPHADMLQKPLTLELIFEKISNHLDLDNIEYDQFSNQYRLEQLKKYSTNIENWLEKFGSLLES